MTRQVDWDLFEKELTETIGDIPSYTLPDSVRDEINRERIVQQDRVEKMLKKEKKWKLNVRHIILSLRFVALKLTTCRREISSLFCRASGERRHMLHAAMSTCMNMLQLPP